MLIYDFFTFRQDYFKKKQEEKLGGKIEDIRKKDEYALLHFP